MKKKNKFRVLRDTNEKENFGWWFEEDDRCEGTTTSNLFTGDYTIGGAEDIFVIERKRNTAEFATNIYEKRFEDELKRMEEFRYPFLILEFTIEDLVQFPKNSGIPESKWGQLKVTNKMLIKRYLEIDCEYRTKIILAGPFGAPVAFSLFKRIHEQTNSKKNSKPTTENSGDN